MKTIRYALSRKKWFQKHGMRITGLDAVKCQTDAYNDLFSTLPSDKEEKKKCMCVICKNDKIKKMVIDKPEEILKELSSPSLPEFEGIKKLDPTNILFQQAPDHTLAVKINQIINTLNKLIIK